MTKMWEDGKLKGRSGADNPMFGKSHSTKTKELLSKQRLGIPKKNKENYSRPGKLNNNANTIRIFNNEDLLIYTCEGNFTKVCKENNLPTNAFSRSYKDGTKLFQTKDSYTRAKNKGILQFENWYAIKG